MVLSQMWLAHTIGTISKTLGRMETKMRSKITPHPRGGRAGRLYMARTGRFNRRTAKGGRMKSVELSPDESGYLLGLMKAHLEYYRLLAGNAKSTPATRAKLAMLEALEIKLRL